MRNSRRRIIVWIILAIMVAGLITFFSSQMGSESSNLSVAFTRRVMDATVGDYSGQMLRHYNGIVRKLAHFALYFVLGVCLTEVLRLQNKMPQMPTAVLIGAVFASLDELHQRFVQGRTPLFSDVLLDTLGVLAGSLIVMGFAVIRRRKRRRESD